MPDRHEAASAETELGPRPFDSFAHVSLPCRDLE